MSDLRLHTNPERYTRLSLEAATAYFEKGTPLSTKIASLVQQNNLNNEEIRRVVEGANHMVHRALRQKTATVEFPVATFEKVAQALGRGTGPDLTHYEKIRTESSTKTAGMHMTHDLQRFFPGEPGYDETLAGLVKEGHHRPGERPKSVFKKLGTQRLVRPSEPALDAEDAWRQREEARQFSKRASQRAEQSKLEEQGDKQIAQENLGAAKVAFLMSLQRFVMDENGDLVKAAEDFATYPKLASAPRLLLDVLKLVKVAGKRMDCPVTFNDATMQALEPENRAKVADQMDPSLYQAGLHISGQPVEIIRGDHQVWKTLDTLIDQYFTVWERYAGPFGSEGRVNYRTTGIQTREIADANHEAARVI